MNTEEYKRIPKGNFPIEAINGIESILKYGASKGHAPASWHKQSLLHHINKAHGHLHDFLYEVERGEDHLACALARLAMAFSVREAQENDNSIKKKEKEDNKDKGEENNEQE